MEIQNENESQNSETFKKEGKSEKPSPDFPIIKVQLPKEAALKVQAALQTLKERKADTRVDELLSEFLDSIHEDYLESQIEKRTPEDYYFEAAKTIPELREKIILQAKKALQKTDKAAPTSTEPKKAKKKEREKGKHTPYMQVEPTEMTQ